MADQRKFIIEKIDLEHKFVKVLNYLKALLAERLAVGTWWGSPPAQA